MKKYTIANAINLVDVCKGKVISSQKDTTVICIELSVEVTLAFSPSQNVILASGAETVGALLLLLLLYMLCEID